MCVLHENNLRHGGFPFSQWMLIQQQYTGTKKGAERAVLMLCVYVQRGKRSVNCNAKPSAILVSFAAPPCCLRTVLYCTVVSIYVRRTIELFAARFCSIQLRHGLAAACCRYWTDIYIFVCMRQLIVIDYMSNKNQTPPLVLCCVMAIYNAANMAHK